MSFLSGAEISRKRKWMRLSQRKAADLIEKMYGVKISHSYLSLIEKGRVDSIGSDLRDALLDFFKVSPCENGSTKQNGSGVDPSGTVHRIPLFGKEGVQGYLDIAGPVLADFALAAASDDPEKGIFRGDILVCRKTKPSEGDLAVVRKAGGFAYIFYSGQDPAGIWGTAVLILKKSLTAEHHAAAIDAAAAGLSEDRLVGELARRTGLKQVDIFRSLAVLKKFSRD